MFTQLMCLEVHLRCEDNKLLLLAFAVHARIVVLFEMLLKSIVVNVVVRLSRIFAVTKETPFVLVPAMLVKLVAIIEALAAESAQGMALESSLVHCTRAVVSVAHVFLKLLLSEELVLMCKHFLVAGAKVTHLLVMGAAHMAVEIRPAQTGKVAFIVGAIIA